MREIKFRGIAGHSGVMIFGFYTQDCFDGISKSVKHGISSPGCYPVSVIKETVGQLTGIKDINGVDIYKGDIIEDHVGIGIVEYCEKHAAFRVNYKNGICKWFYDYTLKGERESITVIGNIHQHAYLLEKKQC